MPLVGRALLPGKPLTQKSPPQARLCHPGSLNQSGVPKLTVFAGVTPVLPALGTFWFAVHGGLRQHVPLGLGSASRAARAALALSCRPSVCLSARVCGGRGPEGSPRAAVSSHASPARGLTSLPSAAAPAVTQGLGTGGREDRGTPRPLSEGGDPTSTGCAGSRDRRGQLGPHHSLPTASLGKLRHRGGDRTAGHRGAQSHGQSGRRCSRHGGEQSRQPCRSLLHCFFLKNIYISLYIKPPWLCCGLPAAHVPVACPWAPRNTQEPLEKGFPCSDVPSLRCLGLQSLGGAGSPKILGAIPTRAPRMPHSPRRGPAPTGQRDRPTCPPRCPPRQRQRHLPAPQLPSGKERDVLNNHGDSVAQMSPPAPPPAL